MSSAHTAAPSNVGSHNVSHPHGTTNGGHNVAKPHGTANPSHAAPAGAVAKAKAMAKKAMAHNSGHKAPAKKAPAKRPEFKAGSSCGNGWGQKKCLQVIMLI